MHCEDCGTKLRGRFCPNCDEEICIEQDQGEFMEGKTEEWDEKVAEQKQRGKKREISPCCRVISKVEGNTTQYYVCSKCGRAV